MTYGLPFSFDDASMEKHDADNQENSLPKISKTQKGPSLRLRKSWLETVGEKCGFCSLQFNVPIKHFKKIFLKWYVIFGEVSRWSGRVVPVRPMGLGLAAGIAPL